MGIKEIAAAANVSPATVSNVLNGKSNVSVETRERILGICEAMGYSAGRHGKHNMQNANRTILFNFSDFDRQFYLKIIQGISDYVYANDYDLLICTSKSCKRFMTKKITSGCIMLDMHCPDELLLEKAAEGYPVIAMDRVLEEPFIKSLVVNNYTPMCELVQTLVDKGYRDYAFLAGLNTDDTRERFQAFTSVLQKNRIPFKREDYLLGDFREKSGYRAAKLLMISEKLPEVLVCANDNMAIGAMRAFREEGIRVPQDIAITGFDDTQLAADIGLTTVAIPNYERGYLAAQYLIALLNGETDYSTFRITATVKWRDSVLEKPPRRER